MKPNLARLAVCMIVVLVTGWLAAFPQISSARSPSQSANLELIRQNVLSFSPWDLVTAVAWSPAGETLAIASGNQVLVYQSGIWQQEVNIEIGAFTRGLAFSPDGTRLAAGSQDGYLRIWQLDQLLEIGASAPSITLPAHRKGVNTLGFSPDGSVLASGGNDAIARFWDPQDGRLLGMTIGGTFAVPSLDFSPEGSTLGVVNGDLIRLRQVGSERIVGTFQADSPLFDVTYSPDGRSLAVSGVDGVVRIWNVEDAYRTGNPVFPEPQRLSAIGQASGSYRDLVWQTVFSRDGRYLASAGGDGFIRMWDVSIGEQISSVFAHPPGVASLAFHPGGDLLASGGLDGSVIIWKIEH